MSDWEYPVAVAVLVLTAPFAWAAYWCWACWFVAREKERNVRRWAIGGLLAGPFAFLPLAFAPDLTEYDEGSDRTSPGARLSELIELRNGGLITVAEFEAKRTRILDGL